MAQPWYQVRHLQQTHGLIAVSANFELYSDRSSRLTAVAGRFAPRLEVHSIYECLLACTACWTWCGSISHRELPEPWPSAFVGLLPRPHHARSGKWSLGRAHFAEMDEPERLAEVATKLGDIGRLCE